MNLFLIGLNHRTAPVAVRERYAVPSNRAAVIDEKLVQVPSLAEVVLVSTCNRTELIGVGPNIDDGLEILNSFLHAEIGDGSARADQLYELRGADVVTHLFELSASLDSMVVGEAQILGQVKAAYRCAVEARSCGPILNRLFQRAFRTGKRIRTETGLGASSVSVARVGVQLAREVFESFEGKRVLLLGAGEMAESAAIGLRDAGVRDTVVVNRSAEPARALALRLDGSARTLDDLDEEIALADVVITSINVERPILTRERLSASQHDRHGRPVLMIDLGIPRNVEPDCQELPDVYVYDLDDLEGVAERGRSARLEALDPARAIVVEERVRFERWYAALPLVPTIRQLRQRTQELLEAELRSAGIASDPRNPDEADLTRMSEAIAAKILHRPLERLRAEAENGTGSYYAQAVSLLFDLDEEED